MAKKKRVTLKTRLTYPVDLVLTHPAVITLPGVAYSAVITLTLIYWQGGCRPLPDDPTSLCQLARISPRGWYVGREPIRAALAEVLPAVAAVYAERVRVYESTRLAAQVGGIARGRQILEAKRLAALSQSGSPAPLTDPTTASSSTPIRPRTAPPRPNQPNTPYTIRQLQAADKRRAARLPTEGAIHD